MKKVTITLILALIFSASYSQTYDPLSLYNYIKAKMWCRAVHLAKTYERNPVYTTQIKYHYYRGLAYQGAYLSDDEMCLQYKDSSLYFALESYLTAFCFYIETDSSTPAKLLDDSTRAKQIIENLDFRKFNDDPIMLGLVDTSLSSVLKLLSNDTTVSHVKKEKYSFIFRCILENCRNMAIFSYLQKENLNLLGTCYDVIYFSLDSTNSNEIVGYFSHDPSIVLVEKKYENGIIQSIKVHYPSGRLYSITKYRNGKRHGTEKKYFESGAIGAISRYKNGKLHGVQKSYSLSGKCMSKSFYKNGERNNRRKSLISSPAW